ncbi:alpha/beta hydrolase [Pseudomonas sp. MTM4]|uniref:alpha/beta hydrolase n=1 Tax=unclassified Pseudomonas TaxID=196821 RepID=UPI0018D215D6|nr:MULTISPECIES: alpha/beta hydrolase [unclassified Pseudomonas]MBC8650832.1 alpha/beta hydrolase [Pseudomonas sp. MT4]QXY91211.1 alpha/beta hydrolase [Pseudomonas sp. MTM4]
MSLDPQIAALMQQLHSQPMPPWSEMTPEGLRVGYKMASAENPEPVAEVREHRIPGPGGELPLRIYRPEREGPLPVLVFFHGGGFVMGDLDSHDNLARAFCNALPAVVVAVDYRLAPEHRFPAAVEDAWAATCWVALHAEALGADVSRLIVGGDSAGGNLAAVIAQLACARQGPAIAHQMLLYPVCDTNLERESYRRYGQGYFLETEMMRWMLGHYLGDPQTRDTRVCPLHTPDLRQLPPATLMTAEYDPLREEGEEYAERLRQAGVPVHGHCYPGAIHGFMSFLGMVGLADRAFADTVVAVRTALSGPSSK